MTFSCPVVPTWVIVMPCLWAMIFETLKARVVVAWGIVLFGADQSRADIAAGAMLLLGTVAAYSAFGLLSAPLTLVFKRGDVLNTAFTASTAMVGGAIFPIDLLPPWLATISRLLPMNCACDGLRKSLLAGSSPAAILPCRSS
jgi:ABC-2 type transport system permease protein